MCAQISKWMNVFNEKFGKSFLAKKKKILLEYMRNFTWKLEQMSSNIKQMLQVIAKYFLGLLACFFSFFPGNKPFHSLLENCPSPFHCTLCAGHRGKHMTQPRNSDFNLELRHMKAKGSWAWLIWWWCSGRPFHKFLLLRALELP